MAIEVKLRTAALKKSHAHKGLNYLINNTVKL